MNKSKSKCANAKPLKFKKINWKSKSNNNKSSVLFHLGAKLKILAIIWYNGEGWKVQQSIYTNIYVNIILFYYVSSSTNNLVSEMCDWEQQQN